MPSAASADLARGPKRLDQVDFTFQESKFEEREKTNGGLPAAFFISQLELNDGHREETAWEIAPVEWLNDRDTGQPKAQVTDDGTFVDIDENNPYQISGSSEAGMLFNSLERNGISSSVMQRLCAEPGLLDGVKVHGVQETTGRTYVAKKGARKGQTIEVTVLVAESVIEDPNADLKKNKKPTGTSTSASKPAAGRPPVKKVVEPEPEPEEESEPADESSSAALNVVAEVLSDPKKHVKTYSARQNDGGVTSGQMATAAMILYKPKGKDAPPKSDVVALIKDAEWAEQNAGDVYTFDSEKGIYFAASNE